MSIEYFKAYFKVAVAGRKCGVHGDGVVLWKWVRGFSRDRDGRCRCSYSTDIGRGASGTGHAD
jgi:hypothetical protein